MSKAEMWEDGDKCPECDGLLELPPMVECSCKEERYPASCAACMARKPKCIACGHELEYSEEEPYTLRLVFL